MAKKNKNMRNAKSHQIPMSSSYLTDFNILSLIEHEGSLYYFQGCFSP
jgi:hypothetical protein